MKKVIILCLLIITSINCSDNSSISTPSFNVSPILGKWQYVEELDYNPPGPYLITNGPIIDLNSDGTFTSNELTNYSGGTFTVSMDSIISLKYISNTNTYTKLKKINLYNDNKLILDNDYLGTGGCVEGCAERYSRVNGN